MPDDRAQTTIKQLQELLMAHPEEWRIEREAHEYPDGTDHFTHVVYTGHDCYGSPMTVCVGSCLTEEMAEFLVVTKRNLGELLRLAEIGIETERARR
jgi:hypothetical protein